MQEAKGHIVGDDNNRLKSKLHSECTPEEGCGEKYTIKGTQTVVELEEGEAVIIPEAFNPFCFADADGIKPVQYKIKGTIKQIASAINAIGGGDNFTKGAEVWKNGRKQQHLTLNARLARRNPDAIKAGSVIINRTNMNNPEVMTFEGSTYEIASAINSYGGNGVELDTESKCNMKEGGSVEKRYIGELDVNLWSNSDENAKKEAQKVVDKIDDEHRPALLHLYEASTPRMARKIFKTGGDVTITKAQTKELGKLIERETKKVKKWTSFQELKRTKGSNPSKTESVDIATMVWNPEEKIDLFKQRERLIKWAKTPENKVKFIVAFSGGKDSVAMVLDLLFNQKIPAAQIELWHHEVDGDGEDLWDWKCTTSYCQEFAKEFGLKILFSYREGGINREIFRNNEGLQDVYYQTETGGKYHLSKSDIPKPENRKTKQMFPSKSASLDTRWCSVTAKISIMSRVINAIEELKNVNAIICTGERRLESANRANYLQVEPYNFARQRQISTWRPVIDWSEEDVWKIYEKFHVQPHPAYEMGWGRCSCQLCIFSSPNHWATNNLISPEKIKRIAEIEKITGSKLDNAKRKIQKVDDKGELMFTKEGKPKMTNYIAGYTKDENGDEKPIHEMLDIYEAQIDRGTSFLTPEDPNLLRWKKEILGKFTSPIIVEDWKVPSGAYKGDDCGAN